MADLMTGAAGAAVRGGGQMFVADGERDAAAGRLVGDRWQWLASMEGVAAKEMMGTTP